MSAKAGAKRPHGQMRQSQLITTFGPGAVVDLPNYSALIGGLDHWSPPGEAIVEPRLAEKLCRLLDVPSIELRVPPPDPQDPSASPSGITVWQFPEWFITQDADKSISDGVRRRMLVHRKQLTGNKFIDLDRKKRNVVPVRFVSACRAGHIADIEWYEFVHGGKTTCRRQLWMEEHGTSGDLSEVILRCDCGLSRSMVTALNHHERPLGNCDGRRPWLGTFAKEHCTEPNRLLIRTASNAYFPQTMSVISLPDRDQVIKAAVDSVWDFVAEVENLESLRYERRKARVNAALESFSDVVATI